MRGWQIVLLALALCGFALYLFWTTTPFYAFQELVWAAKCHDLPKFRQHLDVRGFVDDLMVQLLVDPTESTPGLTRFQMSVANNAVAMARETMEPDIVDGIFRSISETRATNLSLLGERPAVADELVASNDLGDLIRTTTRAVAGSVSQMKEVVFRRMQLYALSHRDTTPCRLLAAPPRQRLQELLAMLKEDGLTVDNFRGVASYQTTKDSDESDICKIGFNFYSPKVAHDIVVVVELRKGSFFGDWQVRRLCDISQVFVQLGEDYPAELHALIQSSLVGISDHAVNDQLRGLGDRITKSDAAKNFLHNLQTGHGF